MDAGYQPSPLSPKTGGSYLKGVLSDVADKPREFTLEELREFDGAQGKPAYIVFEGRVIDVSASKHWCHGHHMVAHRAGRDLSREIETAPHGAEVLERFPQVGALKPAANKGIPPFLARLFHYVPFLKRHPHPLTVHFSIVFMISATGFTLLYLLTEARTFETTAWHCLWGGVLFTPVAIATGLFTWWLNYKTEWLRPVKIKLALSPVLLVASAAALIWRHLDPGILVYWRKLSLLYLGLILSLAPLVAAIGWYGSLLSFPPEK
jgi:predicted heme/steroid binding protein/uncharacterized membrane protein